MKTIGIIGDRDTYRRNHNYYAAVEACGVRTKPLMASGGVIDLKDIDGIVIPGGADINPRLYNEENTASIDIDDELDEYEMAVLKEAVSGHISVLGICRGMQLMNVFFGGTLIQHVPNAKRHVWIDPDTDAVHMAKATGQSFLYDIYHEESISINSAHHQAADRLGEGLEVALISDDGLIEAVYHKQLPIIGVQFHPERMCLENAREDTVDGLKIFEYFITKA